MHTPLDDECQRDRAIKNAAFKIVPLLDGLTLCDATEAIDLAKRIIMTTHKVNAEENTLTVFRREFENAP
jgi:hypothetical protein